MLDVPKIKSFPIRKRAWGRRQILCASHLLTPAFFSWTQVVIAKVLRRDVKRQQNGRIYCLLASSGQPKQVFRRNTETEIRPLPWREPKFYPKPNTKSGEIRDTKTETCFGQKCWPKPTRNLLWSTTICELQLRCHKRTYLLLGPVVNGWAAADLVVLVDDGRRPPLGDQGTEPGLHGRHFSL